MSHKIHTAAGRSLAQEVMAEQKQGAAADGAIATVPQEYAAAMRAEQAEERALDGYFGDRPDALKDRDYDRAHGVFLSQLGQLRQAMNNECYGTVAALMPLTPVRRDPVLDPLQSGLPDTASIHDSLTGLGITIDLRPFKGTLADIRRIELATPSIESAFRLSHGSLDAFRGIVASSASNLQVILPARKALSEHFGIGGCPQPAR